MTELLILLSPLYREPATYIVSKRDSVPSLHYLKKKVTDQPGNVLAFLQMESPQQFFPWSDQLETSSSLISGNRRFNPGSHVTSNCGMMFEYPLGLNFTRVNPVVWQLQNGSRRVTSRHSHAFCRKEQLSQCGPQESVSSSGLCSHADVAALSQTLKDRDQRPQGQEKEQEPWC